MVVPFCQVMALTYAVMPYGSAKDLADKMRANGIYIGAEPGNRILLNPLMVAPAQVKTVCETLTTCMQQIKEELRTMGVTEQRMEQLGIALQQTDWRGKGAVEAVLAGDMLYISAHYPVDENGTPVYVGRVGAEIDEAAAYLAARLCGLNMLRTIQAYIGSLDRVDYFVKALGLVNSAGDFYNMPAAMNGYSDLMVEIFGHRGQHARAAMGACVLPGYMPDSVDAIVKIRR